MRIIAAMNITIDGYCDHTSGIPDDQLHQHYAELLSEAGVLLYGRTTFELMKFWQDVLVNPTGNASMDDFARVMDQAPKLVFSRTMQDTGWASAEMAKQSLEDTVQELQSRDGAGAYVGSPSLIAQLSKQGLLDELQLCIHPVLAGKGMRLFYEMESPRTLRLLSEKKFVNGSMLLRYEY